MNQTALAARAPRLIRLDAAVYLLIAAAGAPL